MSVLQNGIANCLLVPVALVLPFSPSRHLITEMLVSQSSRPVIIVPLNAQKFKKINVFNEAIHSGTSALDLLWAGRLESNLIHFIWQTVST